MKKIISMLLALTLAASVFSLGAVSAAAEVTGVSAWEQKNDGKIYFYADPQIWKNFTYMCLYLYERDEGELITWGSKRGRMTEESDNIWSFDLTGNGYSMADSGHYGVIITADWGLQTTDLIIGNECLGDMAYAVPGEQLENVIDSNKQSLKAAWCNADPAKYGVPVMISSIGNVVGDVYWSDESAYSLFVQFLSDKSYRGICNAVKFNGKTVRETAEDTAAMLGLNQEEYNRAVAESGIDLDNPDNPRPAWYGFAFIQPNGLLQDEGMVYAYIYDEDGNSFFEWGSDNCMMDNWDLNYWAYYFDDHAIQLNPEKTYYVMFTFDWIHQTNPLELDDAHCNGAASLTGNILSGGDADGKKIYEVAWQDNDYDPTVPEWEKRSDGKVYFLADPDIFGESDSVTASVSYYDAKQDAEFLVKTVPMKKEAEENIWSCEVPAEAVAGAQGKHYEIFFTLNGFETASTYLDKTVLGDLAYPIMLDDESGLEFLPVWCNPEIPDIPVWGDLDGDGDLTIQDVTLLQRYLAEFTDVMGMPLLNDEQLALADFNGDGYVNISDATDMQRDIAELFPM